MKRYRIIVVFIVLFFSYEGRAQLAQWAVNTVSGTSVINGLAMDGNGNSYTTGHYYSGIVLEKTHSGSGFFIAKYDDKGTVIWSRVAGSGNSRGLSVAVDATGNVYASGYFQTSIVFGTGSSKVSLSTTQHYRAGFMVKYDKLGNFIWAKQFGGAGNNEGLTELVVDANGNCYVTGTSGSQPFLAKINPLNGSVVWSRSDIRPTDISSDGKHLYIAGNFYATLELGPHKIVSDSGFTNIYYAKFTNGANSVAYLKHTRIRSSGPVRLANDTNGNGYITAHRYHKESFFAGAAVPIGSDSDNIFIAKYGSSGNELWIRTAEGEGNPPPFATDIAADTQGVYATGYFHTSLRFPGGTELKGVRTSVNLSKSYLAKYNTQGGFQWAKASAGISSENTFRLGTNKKGKVIMAGRSQGRASFDCPEYRSGGLWGFSVQYHDATHPLAGSTPPGLGTKPPTPGAISGAVKVCKGQNAVTYTVAAVAGVSSYKWELPAGASVISGAGSNSITVAFGSGATSGNVKAYTVNQYCQSIPATLFVTVQGVPSGTGIVSGPTSVSAGQSGLKYAVTGIQQAVSYQWTLPSGMTAVPSTPTNQREITLVTTAGFTGGILSVQAINACGKSTPSSITIAGASYTISGTIRTPKGTVLTGVQLQLQSSGSNRNTTTDASGYSFAGLPSEKYTVKPNYTTPVVGCIEFFDYISLLNHINNGGVLTSPYKLLAADVNGSKSIDMTDANIVLQVLNGNDLITKKWQFVPVNHSFPVASNPWSAAIPEQLEFNPLQKNETNQSFIGILIGDLNDCK